MSHFACEHCGALCADSPTGYTSGCEHYPPDAQMKNQAVDTLALALLLLDGKEP